MPFAGAVAARESLFHWPDAECTIGDTGAWPLARRLRTFPTGTLTGL